MKVLLTFTGFHDPYCPGMTGEPQEGPILTALRYVTFDAVYLFWNKHGGMPEIAEKTEKAIDKLYPSTKVYSSGIELDSPINYAAILAGLSGLLPKIKKTNKNAEYYVAPASGTPQMHAAWIMLILSGKLDAKILQTTEPKFSTDKRATVKEIDIVAEGYAKIGEINENVIKEKQENDIFEETRVSLGIIGNDKKLIKELKTAETFADSDLSILILGDQGTGKELAAKLIHKLSKRKGEFIPVNCSNLEDHLAASQLFGHKKGSFTGATEDTPGKFKEADGGTIFLDEFASLSSTNQTRLLRVLQEKEIEPLGKKPEKINVKIVAATNANIKEAIKSKQLRRDLYDRISQVVVNLPTLDERKKDIELLANYFLYKISGNAPVKLALTKKAICALTQKSWPGNVRQLGNLITRSAVSCLKKGKTAIAAQDLMFDETLVKEGMELPDPYPGCLDDLQHGMYDKALEMTSGHQKKAAELLGVTPQAVHNYLKRKK